MRIQIRLSAVAAALLSSFLATSTPRAMAADECNADQTQPVVARNGSSVSGQGTLVVNNKEVHVLIRAENLTPGVAYTTWFIDFPNTADCLVSHQCAAADLTMPSSNPAGVFGRMDSAVAKANGKLTFKGAMRDLRVSEGSAIHIALFAHGPASTDDRELARQLLTPQAPGLGAPGLGIDVQKGFLVASAVFDITSCK